ncbi:hypothetical protein A2U01_0095823, partial [Trifolium medium]|nr:hypothetical protein [Trifolium medium]
MGRFCFNHHCLHRGGGGPPVGAVFAPAKTNILNILRR